MSDVETGIVIALGSNLGDRVANLQAAVQAMEEAGVLVGATSAIWETPPVPADQPPYLNAAVRATTTLAPPELLETLKRIEFALGRRPERRWGPRPIDLDILFYGDVTFTSELLQIPHVGIAGRALVLAPLSEIIAGPLPVLGRSAVELLRDTDSTGLTRTGFVLRRGG